MLLAAPLQAQTYPDYATTTVNDYADLLPPTEEAALVQTLTDLRADTGVEMTVLTIYTQADYAPGWSLEAFATGLFNEWGIGDAERNDGVLILVIRGDRTMRIELGAAYGRASDAAAGRVVDNVFLTAFRAEDYAGGIMRGTQATIDDIVLPLRAGEDAPSGANNEQLWIFAAIAAIFGLFGARGPIGDAMARFRTCPACGQRTLRQSRRTDIHASTTSSGSGTKRIWCTNCDYEETSSYIIPMRSKSSSSSFGGGRSGGGGASGRW